MCARQGEEGTRERERVWGLERVEAKGGERERERERETERDRERQRETETETERQRTIAALFSLRL